MTHLRCTCSEDGICQIHKTRYMLEITKPKLSRRGYLLTCLCDCGCTTCALTPLSQLIQEQKNIELYIINDAGVRKRLYISDHE